MKLEPFHKINDKLAQKFPDNKFVNGTRRAKRQARQAQFREKVEAWKQRPAVQWMTKFSLLMHVLLAALLVIIIESCSRHSVISAFSFMVESPVVFLYNMFLIFTSLLIVYLFKRRMLFRIVISVFWILLGVVNGIILASRVTPFNFTDFKLISDLLAMKSSKYVTVGESILIVLCLCGVGAFIVFMAIRGPKFSGKIHRVRNLIGLAACVAVIPFITKAAIHSDILAGYFGNLAQGYEDYGFVYSFSASVVDTGMNKPANYSEETIDKILNQEEKKTTTLKKEDEPNIIFVQLESFVDPYDLTFLNYSEDPTPNYHKLMKQYSSGYLTVPVVGAGTANTEFEVMTGMSLKFFGLGEYPFKTILKTAKTESVATDLSDIGYATHVLHNNGGNFYSRATVFRNMGYDSFTSKEEMNITEYNEIQTWPKDHILVNETKKTLDSTKNKSDYIYTITVQSHGSYPTEKVFDNPEIKVTGGDTKASNNQWEYYINELHEVDQYIGDLIEMLQKRDEKTIVVMYGDHLPTMGLEESDVKSGNLFNTKYVTWNNFGLDLQDKNLKTYQLTAYIMDKLGIHEGTIFKYHQTQMHKKTTKKASYLKNLEQLQYDLLYGKVYSNNEKAYTGSDMEMGVEAVTIKSLSRKDHSSAVDEEQKQTKSGNTADVNEAAKQSSQDQKKENDQTTAADDTETENQEVISIRGKNFTPWSTVYVNGKSVSTTYISGTELEIKPSALSDGCTITVQQMGSNNTVFRRSNTLTLPTIANLKKTVNDPSTSSGRYSDTSVDLKTVLQIEEKKNAEEATTAKKNKTKNESGTNSAQPKTASAEQ